MPVASGAAVAAVSAVACLSLLRKLLRQPLLEIEIPLSPTIVCENRYGYGHGGDGENRLEKLNRVAFRLSNHTSALGGLGQ